MKITVSKVIYNLLVNIPVCLALALAGAFLGGSFSWVSLLINFAISFVLAMCIGLFIPLTAIGRWFTGLFHVRNDTYTHNLPYRLLATLISSLIFYFIISPVLMVANYFLNGGISFNEAFLNYLIDIPFMILVGYTSTLISDLFGYKVAHRVDGNF